jgi:hypothetical protein
MKHLQWKLAQGCSIAKVLQQLQKITTGVKTGVALLQKFM